MQDKVMFFQLLIVLASALLCVSQQCQDEVYTNNLKYASCEEIYSVFPDTPSGYYLLASAPEKVYCDMENRRCGSQGWTRVAFVNMSSETSSCPGNLNLYKTPIRSCGGIALNAGCAVAQFSTYGITYSQVCGRVVGYQVGRTNAFGPYFNDPDRNTILDGILISHGENREHIWAYAAGFQRMPSGSSNLYCPCTSQKYSGVVPAFIGNDYYCDSGVDDEPEAGKFYTNPLWAGQACKPPNYCCQSEGLPWFCKTLADPTSDYIEIRSCHNQETTNEDTTIQLMELYIR